MQNIKISTKDDARKYIEFLADNKLQYHLDESPADVFPMDDQTQNMTRLHDELWAIANPWQILEDSDELWAKYINL